MRKHHFLWFAFWILVAWFVYIHLFRGVPVKRP